MDVRVEGARRGANPATALFDLGFDAGDRTAPVMATRGFGRQLQLGAAFRAREARLKAGKG